MRSIKMMLGTLVALSGFLFMACAVSTEEPEETEDLAEAEGAFSYPTKWTLTNSTAQSLTFDCTCPKPYGLTNPIVMDTTTVAAGQTKVYQWSSWWYNDGLGLNHCSSWSCKATASGGATYATTSFATGWGENITLKALAGGQLVRQ